MAVGPGNQQITMAVQQEGVQKAGFGANVMVAWYVPEEDVDRIGRLMVLREVLGQSPAGWSSVTKTWCTELEQRVADFCAAVAGPEALLWNRFSRGACYAPAYTLMGGTTQILRNIIGERSLGLPREPAVDREVPFGDLPRSEAARDHVVLAASPRPGAARIT